MGGVIADPVIGTSRPEKSATQQAHPKSTLAGKNIVENIDISAITICQHVTKSTSENPF